MLPLILTKLMLENVDFFFGRQVGNLLLSPGIKETIPPHPHPHPPSWTAVAQPLLSTRSTPTTGAVLSAQPHCPEEAGAGRCKSSKSPPLGGICEDCVCVEAEDPTEETRSVFPPYLLPTQVTVSGSLMHYQSWASNARAPRVDNDGLNLEKRALLGGLFQPDCLSPP